jgi:hypothetical protein
MPNRPDIPAWRGSRRVLEVHPHKVRYYLERRDEAFEQKMADVLCVYREVAVLRESEAVQPNVAISYDEKPGIQPISNTGHDLPQPGSHAGWARDHEYKRHGTLSLLAGIDLLIGKVHACVENRHRSREFVGFLKKPDAVYATDTAIKLILDNHSAHISPRKQTPGLQPSQRAALPLYLSRNTGPCSILWKASSARWLDPCCAASKDELKSRILAYLDDLNKEPVVHTWTYKLDTVA